MKLCVFVCVFLHAGSAALAVTEAVAALGRRLHVVMEGWDKHAESSTHFETSISLDKVRLSDAIWCCNKPLSLICAGCNLGGSDL